MDQKNRLKFLLFTILVITGVYAGYSSWVFVAKVSDYMRHSQTARGSLLDMQAIETPDVLFVPQFTYTYSVGDTQYQKTQVLHAYREKSPDRVIARWSALESAPLFVYYPQGFPEQASIVRRFPIKQFVYAVISLCIVFYFFFLLKTSLIIDKK